VRDPDVLNRFREFYQQTRRHVEILTRVIASLGGDPMYMSHGAKAAEEKAQAILKTMTLSDGMRGRGSGDQRDREYRNRGNQRSRRLAITGASRPPQQRFGVAGCSKTGRRRG
jgi:hypothetical protein